MALHVDVTQVGNDPDYTLYRQRAAGPEGPVTYWRMDGPCYGVGWRPTTDWRIGVRGHLLWLNTYRRAPLKVRWLCEVGWVHRHPAHRRLVLTLSGSQAEPDTHWRLLVGRLVLGGWTPKVLRRLRQWRLERQWAREDDEAYYGGPPQ